MDELDRECMEAIARDDYREERRAKTLGMLPKVPRQRAEIQQDTEHVEHLLKSSMAV